MDFAIPYLFLLPVLLLLSAVGFSIFAHGAAELALTMDARNMALEQSYHIASPCPRSTSSLKNISCRAVDTSLFEDGISVPVRLIQLRATTLSFGILSDYIETQAVVPSAKQASL